MISILLIHPNTTARAQKAEMLLKENKLSKNHPNLLWLGEEEKLGIEQARQIKEFLSLKPYQGQSQAIVLISADNLTLDAQNALLKTLEEPPEHALIILGASSEEQLLPTIISRCQTVNIIDSGKAENTIKAKFEKDIEKLLQSNTEQRFQYVEKLSEREQLLPALTTHFRHELLTHPHKKEGQAFLKDLVEAERWAGQNVNIRAILEYLMLRMPNLEKNN